MTRPHFCERILRYLRNHSRAGDHRGISSSTGSTHAHAFTHKHTQMLPARNIIHAHAFIEPEFYCVSAEYAYIYDMILLNWMILDASELGFDLICKD